MATRQGNASGLLGEHPAGKPSQGSRVHGLGFGFWCLRLLVQGLGFRASPRARLKVHAPNVPHSQESVGAGTSCAQGTFAERFFESIATGNSQHFNLP